MLQDCFLTGIIIIVFKNRLFCGYWCEMDKKKQIETKSLEIVEPIGKRVLIRKDEDKKQTKGGIRLPDNPHTGQARQRLAAKAARRNPPE